MSGRNASETERGKVKWCNADRGFGFNVSDYPSQTELQHPTYVAIRHDGRTHPALSLRQSLPTENTTAIRSMSIPR